MQNASLPDTSRNSERACPTGSQLEIQMPILARKSPFYTREVSLPLPGAA
jgi:hypothetical protein